MFCVALAAEDGEDVWDTGVPLAGIDTAVG